MSKTHFRKVFKSDHLGVADLEDFLEEGVDLVFTIKEVKQEINVPVAGRKGNYNIAYFEEPIKPLVLNVTNSSIVKRFNQDSPWVEDWGNTRVKLYIDPNVKMKGSVVGGVRIRTIQPPMKKAKPQFTEQLFEKAFNSQATVVTIKKHYTANDLILKKYESYVKTAKK
jgi:hypothetical protein